MTRYLHAKGVASQLARTLKVGTRTYPGGRLLKSPGVRAAGTYCTSTSTTLSIYIRALYEYSSRELAMHF